MDQEPGSTPRKVAASVGAGGLACLTYFGVTILVWLALVAVWDGLDLPDNYYVCVGSPLIAAAVPLLLVLPGAVLFRKRRWLGWSVGVGALLGSLVVPALFFLALGVLWLGIRLLCANAQQPMAGC